MQRSGNALELLDGLGTFKFHQLVAVAGFHPADPVIRHEKTHHVAVTEIGHKRGTVAVTVIAADVTSCGKSLLLQTIRESAKAHHQVFNNRSVVLSQTREHGRRALNAPILSFSSGLRG